jgi:hypothetical protein
MEITIKIRPDGDTWTWAAHGDDGAGPIQLDIGEGFKSAEEALAIGLEKYPGAWQEKDNKVKDAKAELVAEEMAAQ